MKNDFFFNLQLFAEDTADNGAAGAEENTGAGAGTDADTPEADKDKKPNPRTTAKYSDDDVDKIVARVIAKERKAQEQKASEAERLGKMTAEERANERMKALEDRIRDYEMRETRAEMTKQARAMLQDKGLNVGDELLASLVSDDADDTKAAVEGFITLFNEAVEKAVKEKVRGEVPTAGGSSAGVTKEQILAIPNRVERQRMMKEHADLF